MNRSRKLLLAAAVLSFSALGTAAQNAQTVKPPDERFKTDILVVVAHPDDEGGVTPYLARAIYDEHKRVAVVYGTHGGSGANEYRRETGPALADVREQEARQACAALGITNVWFLSGKDTASQNVLNSLASWGHGENLEQLVRIVRLTRPEVIITWLPGVFIGENHGDHQAAGVLATEAFDLAADPTAFPAQIAGASKRLEPFLESLSPWQPKKIYYFSDANDEKQFAGTGPAYAVRVLSPSRKKTYARLALDSAAHHLTQFSLAQELSKMTDEQIDAMVNDPSKSWWTDPMVLIFGKSAIPTKRTDDVFAGISPESTGTERAPGNIVSRIESIPDVELAGPWLFYKEFRSKHALTDLPVARNPEIAQRTGLTLSVPLIVRHAGGKEIDVKVAAPEGWNVTYGAGKWKLPAEPSTQLRVDIATPTLAGDALKNFKPQLVTVTVSENGKALGQVELRVGLISGGLPQN